MIDITTDTARFALCLTCLALGHIAHLRPWSRRRPTRDPRQGWAWQRLVRQVLQRDGHRCRVALPGCTHHATTADHIVPLAQGGAHALANLRAACRWCNREAMFRLQGKRQRWPVDSKTGVPTDPEHFWNQKGKR